MKALFMVETDLRLECGHLFPNWQQKWQGARKLGLKLVAVKGH